MHSASKNDKESMAKRMGAFVLSVSVCGGPAVYGIARMGPGNWLARYRKNSG